MSWVGAVCIVAAAGAGAAALWLRVLARWPEPQLADGEEKTRYATLGQGRRWLVVTAAAIAVATVVCLVFPAPARPAGLVLATLGVVLAACDGWTTWIPARLCHLGWLATLLAAAGSTVLPGGTVATAAAAVVCGVVAFAGFAVLWWRGLCGFSDARYVVLLAVTAGLVSVTAAAVSLALGCLLAAAHAGWLRHRGHLFFPWAPGLLLGTVLGTAAASLLG